MAWLPRSGIVFLLVAAACGPSAPTSASSPTTQAAGTPTATVTPGQPSPGATVTPQAASGSVPAAAQAPSPGGSTRPAGTPPILGTTAPPALATAPLTDASSGLVAYWPFDEGAGPTAADGSGGGHTATIVNGVTWATGKTGGALSFNGTNGYLSTAYRGISGTSARTFVAWVKTTGCASPRTCDILTYGGEATGQRIEWSVEGNATGLRIFAEYIVYDAPGLVDGSWHQLAVAVPQGAALDSVAMYLDGVRLTSVKESLRPTSTIDTGTTNPINIGRMYAGANVMGQIFPNGGAYFSGFIDDLRIYARTLTAAEIADLARAGS